MRSDKRLSQEFDLIISSMRYDTMKAQIVPSCGLIREKHLIKKLGH